VSTQNPYRGQVPTQKSTKSVPVTGVRAPKPGSQKNPSRKKTGKR
jgi:hypothetical protein